MTLNSSVVRNKPLHEGLITALAFGGFFIILGLTVVLTPNYVEQINSFFGDLTTVTHPVPNSSSTFSLVAPAHPADHLIVFTGVMNFFIGIAILQIVILAARFWAHSRIRRIAETIGNLVFWLGGAFVANVFLLAGTQTGWFQFWSWLIILLGVSLIAQFLVYLASRARKPIIAQQ